MLGAGVGIVIAAVTDVVVVAGVRTPRGKGSAKGGLHGATPIELVAHLLGALRLPAAAVAEVDDFILGCATQADEQGANLARTATLCAGWDARVPMFADRGPLYADPAVAAKAGAVHMGVAGDLIATLDGCERDALDDYAEASRAARSSPTRSGASCRGARSGSTGTR